MFNLQLLARKSSCFSHVLNIVVKMHEIVTARARKNNFNKKYDVSFCSAQAVRLQTFKRHLSIVEEK